MKKFDIKKILLPTDFSDTANNALRQAILMSKLAGAELKLLYVIEPEMNFGGTIPIPQNEYYYERLKITLLDKLSKIASEIETENGIKVTCETRFDSVYKQICSVALDESFDLIIMGTHGNSGVSEFFIGSNASKVIANAECPVITIQQKAAVSGFKTIILPIRAEIYSRQKVDYVVELAKLYTATVFITGYANKDDEDEQFKVKQYVNQVENYLLRLNINHNSTNIVGDNFTKDLILLAQKNNADLIAVMNETSFSFDHLIKGPFAKQFVNHSPVPILSVPVYSNPDLISYSPYLSGEIKY